MSQHTYKALALGAVLGFLTSVVPSCGSSGGATCGPSNCSTGCCNANKCVTGTNSNNTTCGTAGLSCVDCTKTAGSSCSTSTFKCSGAGGAGGGSGVGGGAGGGTASCSQSCAGCCDATGACQTGSAATACGTGGATCASCTSPATCVGNVCKDTSCTKCTKGGACQATLSDTACGNGGIECLDCAASGGATCNTATGVCAGGTCNGCRDANGACQTGNTKGACGTSGTCSVCSGTQVCSNGACVNPGTGGGAGGGGGGTAGTCPGGAPCSNGCCSGGTCIATTFQSPTNCGINAASCASCGSGQLCNVGVCGGSGGGAGGGGGGGPAPGSLGSACTADTDCTGITISSTDLGQGYKAFCKKTMNPTGHAYPGGMCTRRCLDNATCGTGNYCDYQDGPFGEIDNICLVGCATTPCREGYKCYNYGTTAAPLNECYPAFPDGGDIGPFDPGPGNSANEAAGPCTDDTMCAPQTPAPALGFCIKPVTADGGPTGFQGGACSAECNQALFDSWCGTNGNCNGFVGGTTSTGPSVVFLCQQGCPLTNDGGVSTCRTGYTCSAATNGTCIPRCDEPGRPACMLIDPTKPVCNATTGLCGT